MGQGNLKGHTLARTSVSTHSLVSQSHTGSYRLSLEAHALQRVCIRLVHGHGLLEAQTLSVALAETPVPKARVEQSDCAVCHSLEPLLVGSPQLNFAASESRHGALLTRHASQLSS